MERLVAIREGTRRENATSGCGDMEMEAKEDKVAPWNGCGGTFVEELELEDVGIYDVITATGCAVSRNRTLTRLCTSVLPLCREQDVEFQRLQVRLGLQLDATWREICEIIL